MGGVVCNSIRVIQCAYQDSAINSSSYGCCTTHLMRCMSLNLNDFSKLHMVSLFPKHTQAHTNMHISHLHMQHYQDHKAAVAYLCLGLEITVGTWRQEQRDCVTEKQRQDVAREDR